MTTIHVLGPGCPKCTQAEKIVREAVEESGKEIEVVKVSDFQDIAQFGVFATPAVVVDGTVKISGGVPKPKDVQQWIKELGG